MKSASPSSVIAIPKGGLGNQLFIYAAARALSLRTNRQLYLDTQRGYIHDSYSRSYRLNRFLIHAEVMPEAWRVAPTLRHFRHKFIRAWNKLLPRNQRTYFAERWNLPPTQLTALQPRRKRITLLGYWQNEDYFTDFTAVIRKELQPPTPTDNKNQRLGEKFAASESVFLHFRRVRYRYLLGADYYQQAIDQVCEKLKQPLFVLFGDDLEWAKQRLNLHGATTEYIWHNHDNELADLWLMSRCRHAVVANSSFSWWGAWLGDTAAQRLVFAPQHAGLPIAMSPRWQRLANGFISAL